ncbi:MAG: hypothetical protein FIB02_08615 [Desulfuromonas sp.]|nr:hypothetical protein [Desulfuromonas sp.]
MMRSCFSKKYAAAHSSGGPQFSLFRYAEIKTGAQMNKSSQSIRAGFLRSIFYIICLSMFLTGCSSILKIQANFIPPGSLRLAQAIAVADRSFIIKSTDLYDAILSSGITDAEITDESVIAARIYCCGGVTYESSSEKVNEIMIFVPSGTKIEYGDIVEFKAGWPPKNGENGQINILTRVVQKLEGNGEQCWWDPKDDRLWLRTLYCDWMPKEGWVKQGGLDPAWYRPNIP